MKIKFKSRAMLTRLFLLFTVAPFIACASTKVVVIETMDVPIVTLSSQSFQSTLKQHFNEGIQIEVYNMKGNTADSKRIVDTISETSEPDLIVTVATLASRLAAATEEWKHIPKLFMVVADPIGEGFTKRFGEVSSSKLSGESHVITASNKLNLVSRSLSQSSLKEKWEIALVSSDYPSSVSEVKALQAAITNRHPFSLTHVSTPYLSEAGGADEMIKSIVQKIESSEKQFDALWFTTGPILHHPTAAGAIAQTVGVPILFAEDSQKVKDGAIMGMIVEPEQIGRSLAAKAIQVLTDEAEVRSMPISRITSFQIIINLSAALQHNIVIPSDILRNARVVGTTR
ncbi:ABC transporter substrate-binding protein [Alteromonas oceani]|uniref:ABC transporter substrate-binding protein n=1 Tax=Alteromonas oceani TaxID=2071609 RepID=A0ABV7K2H8_9ALTE|nr:ABC transporter substrate binding protein [Alteromonas oceani]